MRTEKEFLNAMLVIKEYTNQLKDQSENAMKHYEKTRTMKQLLWTDHSIVFSTRLYHILRLNDVIENTRLCDITKKDFLAIEQAGLKSWAELCEITGNKQ